MLILKFREVIHRLIGVIILLAGATWAMEIIKTFIEEAA